MVADRRSRPAPAASAGASPPASPGRRLRVFTQLSLDGYFVDADGDMSWAHRHDAEWSAFVAENARGGGALLFGRVTYEQMASFWPTPAGRAANAGVAERMTAATKYVASRSLGRTRAAPAWANTTVLGGGGDHADGDLAAHVRELKATPGPDLTVLGSGTVVAQLAAAGLADEFQLVTIPVVLGSGRSPFAGVDRRMPMGLTRTRAFANGNVVSWYEPAAVAPAAAATGRRGG